jgi:hypothetical protein
MKEKALKIVVESIDLKKLAIGIFDEVLEEAVKSAVAKSPNKIDDALLPMLWPLIEAEFKKLVEEKLDLAKILKLEE